VGTLSLFVTTGFVLGLLFGSFLNVCIARLPQGESIVKPRSRCPHCGKAIRWFDNIPVLSWLLLRGRCRDCKQPISIQYPLVELATGLWFAVAGAHFRHALHSGIDLTASQIASASIATLSFAILGFLLIGLMVMDWQTMLLPDAFTFTGIAIAFLRACIRAFFLGPTEDQIVLNSTHQLRLSSPGSFASQGNIFLTGPEALLGGWLVSTLGAAAILLIVRWLYKLVRHREGMGLGDVKLLAMIAAFLGFWPAVLSLFAGVIFATIYALFLLARRQANAMTRLAFGSFLALGGLVAAIFGDRLIDAYRTLLH